MKLHKSYKYKLTPTVGQQVLLRRFAGSCRFVYNKALATQEENNKSGGKFIGYVAMAKLLTTWRNNEDTSWLMDVPCHAQQYALRDLDDAYRNFFAKRAKHPQFKKKGKGDSFRLPDPARVKVDQINSRIFIPKLDWIHYRNSRAVLGTIKNITVSFKGGNWFVSVLTEQDIGQPVHTAVSSVGIDVGITRFATLSDGTYIDPLNSRKTHQSRLAHYQKEMARKKQFSNNWKKAKNRVQRLHIHIANCRKDFLHKLTTTISKNHAIVCIEDLRVESMGKLDPNKGANNKAALNTAILDQGWYMFRRQLEYKQTWLGGQVIAVPPEYTSQTCPSCGHVSADNRLTQSKFKCVGCGYENNADMVGALNILAAGHAVLACGEVVQSGHSVKQEPAEVIVS